jgi:hypothetical protein
LPFFYAKKEVFQWLKEDRKTIDIRKGLPHKGDMAVFQSGPRILRRKVVKTESGKLSDIVQQDNYRLIIPSAKSLCEATKYLRGLYGSYDGVFTAYYLEENNTLRKT